MQRIMAPAVALTAAALLVLAAPAAAQTTNVLFEAGYQWVDIDGNEDVYATQVNEDDGFILGALSISTVDPFGGDGLADRMRLDASGFGGHPDGRLRLEASRAGTYSLHLNYRRGEYYNALPGYANPLGATVGQHTFDRTLDSVDLEVEGLPGSVVSPLFGYRYVRYDGPGTTTYSVGGDDFRVHSDLDSTEQEIYGGIVFHAGRFHGRVTQGWRDQESTSSYRLADGTGNLTDPLLGNDIFLSDLSARTESESEAPVTRAFVNGALGSRVRVLGSFVRADYDLDVAESEMLSGSLASFALRRFFGALDRDVDGSAESLFWRGEARLEADLSDHFTVMAGYTMRHREMDGFAMVQELFLDTVNFSGFEPRDIERMLDLERALEREQSTVDVELQARGLGPFRAWVGYSLTDQEVDVTQEVAGVVTPGRQAGLFEREIDRYTAGLGYMAHGVIVAVDVHQSEADDPVVRTDFLDRDRARLRVGWERGPFRITGTAEQIDSTNDLTGIEYDAETEHFAATLDVMPSESLTLTATWDSYDTDTSILYLMPHNFAVDTSFHAEETEVLEGSILWKMGDFGLDLGYSMLENEGSLPLELDRAFARLGYDFSPTWGTVLAYDSWDYDEELLPLADYEATRLALLVRYRR